MGVEQGPKAAPMLNALQCGRAVAAIMVAVFHANVFLLPNRASRFLRKRILRIYPICWLVLAFLVSLYALQPGRGPDQTREPLAIVTSALLWPMPQGPIMQVAWTLQHEMLFLFGIIAALIHARLTVAQARASFWIGTALFLSLGLAETLTEFDPPQALLPLGYGLGAALAVIGLAQGRLPAPRGLAFLGDASYAIYLVHLPAMNILAVGIRAVGLKQVLPPLAMRALVKGGVTAIGALVHLFIERPLTARLGARRTT